MNKSRDYVKTFLSYIGPTVLAFALSGVYVIVDGYFVGNSLGDAGLAAISIAFPIVALFLALGTGVGMGGAVMFAISRASGKEKESRTYSGITMTLLLISAALSVAVFLPVLDPLLAGLGASGTIAQMGHDYLFILILFSATQIFGTGVVPLVRNNGGSSFAMIIMIAGFGTNIVLDWLFIWIMNMGLSGAATATAIGQAVTAVGGIAYLKRKRVKLISSALGSGRAGRILKIGASAFGLTLCPEVTILLMNRFFISFSSVDSVAAFAVITYLASIVYMLLQGVGDGAQPLFSDSYGRGSMKEAGRYRFMAYIAAEIIAAVCLAALCLTKDVTGMLFGASETVQGIVSDMMLPVTAGFLFVAVSRVVISFFYATKDPVKSAVITYSEVIFLFIFLLIFAPVYGDTAIWWCMPASQVASSVLAAALMAKTKNRRPETAV